MDYSIILFKRLLSTPGSKCNANVMVDVQRIVQRKNLSIKICQTMNNPIEIITLLSLLTTHTSPSQRRKELPTIVEREGEPLTRPYTAAAPFLSSTSCHCLSTTLLQVLYHFYDRLQMTKWKKTNARLSSRNQSFFQIVKIQHGSQ